MFKYWTRLNKTGDNLLFHALHLKLAENRLMVENYVKSWAQLKRFLRNLICLTVIIRNQINLIYLWKMCHSKDSKIYEERVRNKLVSATSKQRVRSWELTYRTYKTIFKFENYLTENYNENDKFIINRYRTSNHRLQIKIGRPTIPKTPIHRAIARIAPLVKLSKLNIHFFKLPYYCKSKKNQNDFPQICQSKSSGQHEKYTWTRK